MSKLNFHPIFAFGGGGGPVSLMGTQSTNQNKKSADFDGPLFFKDKISFVKNSQKHYLFLLILSQRTKYQKIPIKSVGGVGFCTNIKYFHIFMLNNSHKNQKP